MDFIADIQHTRNGNILMYGITGVPQRLKLLLVNQSGDSILGKQLTIMGGNRQERQNSSSSKITPLSDGGFVISAEIDTSVTNTVNKLGMVVKVNANLQKVWHYIHRTLPINVTFTASCELTDGSVLMLGSENKLGYTGRTKFFLYRFSTTGSLLNIYTFTTGIAINVVPNSLVALPDSSFIAIGTGMVTGAPNLNNGIYVAKVKVSGLPPGLPLPAPILGNKESLETTTAILGQSFPNPATEETTIPYQLSNGMKAGEIVIRDILGRVVNQYNLKVKQGYITVDTRVLTNGLYTYTLYADHKPLATKKLTVVK